MHSTVTILTRTQNQYWKRLNTQIIWNKLRQVNNISRFFTPFWSTNSVFLLATIVSEEIVSNEFKRVICRLSTFDFHYVFKKYIYSLSIGYFNKEGVDNILFFFCYNWKSELNSLNWILWVKNNFGTFCANPINL